MSVFAVYKTRFHLRISAPKRRSADIYSRYHTKWMGCRMYNSWRRITKSFPRHYAVDEREYSCRSLPPPARETGTARERERGGEREKNAIHGSADKFPRRPVDSSFSPARRGDGQNREDPLESTARSTMDLGVPDSTAHLPLVYQAERRRAADVAK